MRTSTRITYLFSGLAILGGISGLIGWWVHSPELKSVIPDFISMKANAALGLILIAISIALTAQEKVSLTRRRMSVVFAVAAWIIGILTLAEYIFQVDLKIDQFMFVDLDGVLKKTIPGRPAPVTAISFVLLSTSLILTRFRKWQFHKTSQLLTLLVILVSVRALVGFAFGINEFFGTSFYTQMALHTAFILVLVSVALVASRSQIGFTIYLVDQSFAGISLRSIVASIIFIPAIISAIVLVGQKRGYYGADTSVIVRMLGGSCFLVYVVIRNIVFLHKSESKRKESEQNFKELADTIPQIAWVSAVDGSVSYYNANWYEYTGNTPGDSHDRRWENVIHPDDLEVIDQEFSRALKQDTPFSAEYRILRKSDGTYRWHLGRAIAVRDSEGRSIRRVGTATDIDDQKRAEAARATLMAQEKAASAIRASEARLRAIFESASDAIIGMNDLGIVTDWNPQAELIFGWSLQEAIGRKMIDIVISPDQRENFAKKMKDGAIRPIELEGIRKSGAIFPIQLSVSPVPLQGNLIFTAFISDITERKKSETDLINARKEAERSAQVKSNFLANMSHEIRTPLNGVIGMADLLVDTTLDPLQKKYAKIIQDSGVGLLTIINDILDFSKIEAGKLEFEMIPFSPIVLVEGQAELLASRARDKKLSLLTYIDSEMPKGFMGDPGRIGQILLNLISNAIKFTDRGSIIVRGELAQSDSKSWPLSGVTSSSSDAPTVAKFSVIDSGIGLSEASKKRLFQPFTQADGSTARKYGGTGLGLSICRKLVELMGGEIGVDSVEGEGSVFWFTIPLTPLDGVAEELHEFKQIEGNMNVLIVDDDPPARLIMDQYIKSWGFVVTTVSNGEDALRLLRERAGTPDEFQIALIDKQMPGLDGFSLAKKIHNDPFIESTKLILTTAFDRISQAEAAIEFGFDSYLTKPVKQLELYEAISCVLAKNSPSVKESAFINIATAPESPDRQRRILVAEDNAVNQLLALTQLKKLGYAAQAVANGKEALDAIKSTMFDLILMDCQMPDMDGFEATLRIRKNEIQTKGHIPIIALTANALKEDEEKCLVAGMDGHISKPVKKEKLAEVLSYWLPDRPETKPKFKV